MHSLPSEAHDLNARVIWVPLGTHRERQCRGSVHLRRHWGRCWKELVEMNVTVWVSMI